MKFMLGIPGMLSWLAFGDLNARVDGIADLREAGYPTPPFVITFLAFHAMVLLGFFLIALTAFGTVLLWRGRLYETRWFLKLLLWSVPVPLVACQVGWIVAEVGRQPWVVYRLLKTCDAFSTNVSAGEVLFSIVMFGLIYLALGVLYLLLLVRQVKHGPEPLEEQEVRS
jgi:cytochrome d ubiquinol oxidase subunit I